ncbi:MAG: HDOD domain-containing protein [Gemmatimonadaceae bacterium]|nr:HDOD domain-containing protein [Gemmatimonadaceae bacterium]
MNSAPSRVVESTDASLASRITELVDADEVSLPPLPQVVIKARELLSSESANAKALGTLLSQDSAIVTSLMRLANSAAFGGLGRVDSLNTAIQRIGQRQIGAIVMGLGLKDHYKTNNPAKAQVLEVLWNHSVTSAFAARAIAARTGMDPERAFLAGLLHDCGKVLVLSALDLLHARKEVSTLSVATVHELMRALHCELGHRVLEAWKLPSDVAQVALLHHERTLLDHGLVLPVKAANLITRRLGFHLEPDPTLSIIEDPVIEELGLTDLQVATLMVEMELHLEEMRQLF